MADERVRKLEREAATGDPAACVRYSAILEREGRRGEAARVLRGAGDSEAAREALLRFTAWTHGNADAGRTNALDVEPVTKKPRVLWRAKVRGAPHRIAECPRLLASPLGVVVVTTRGVEVLDPDTGTTRWRRDSPSGPRPHSEGTPTGLWRPRVEILGRTLLVWNQTVVWRRDLVSGEDRGVVEVPRTTTALLDRGLLLAAEENAIVARSVALDADGEEVWRSTLAVARSIDVLSAAGEVVFARGATGLHALDRKTGKKRWSARTVSNDFLADVEGVVSCEEPGPQRVEPIVLVLRGANGKPFRRVEGFVVPMALGAEVVVTQSPPILGGGDPSHSIPDEVFDAVAIDRESGESVELPLSGSLFLPLAMARDAIVGAVGGSADTSLGACGQDGTSLWALSMKDLAGPRAAGAEPMGEWALALLDRAIFVLLSDGTLVALTDL